MGAPTAAFPASGRLAGTVFLIFAPLWLGTAVGLQGSPAAYVAFGASLLDAVLGMLLLFAVGPARLAGMVKAALWLVLTFAFLRSLGGLVGLAMLIAHLCMLGLLVGIRSRGTARFVAALAVGPVLLIRLLGALEAAEATGEGAVMMRALLTGRW